VCLGRVPGRAILAKWLFYRKFIFDHIIVDEIIQILDKAIPTAYTLCHEEKSLVVAKPKVTGFR
jgi:hypothetical protein